MNNKGFTTVELILTLSVVLIIMTTITSVTYTYRDRSLYEESETEIFNYKNTVTKIIYDDILDIKNINGPITIIEQKNENKYYLKNNSNIYYILSIINEENKVGIQYETVKVTTNYETNTTSETTESTTKYIIPGSNDNLIKFDKVDYKETDNYYLLDIYFYQKSIDQRFKIHLIVSK